MAKLKVTGIQWGSDDDKAIKNLPTAMLIDIPNTIKDKYAIEEHIQNQILAQSGSMYCSFDKYEILEGKPSLPDIIQTLQGGWGEVSFYEPTTDTYVKINVTYDYDYVYNVFAPQNINFDAENNTLELLDGATSLANGYYAPEIDAGAVDGEFDNDVMESVLNRHMDEIIKAIISAKNEDRPTDNLLPNITEENTEEFNNIGIRR